MPIGARCKGWGWSFLSSYYRRRPDLCALQRLGRDDPQGVWNWPSVVPLLWRQNVNHLFYRRAEDNRQDYRSPQADIWGRTAASASSCPTGASDGCRGERGVFLRAWVVVLYLFWEKSLCFCGWFSNLCCLSISFAVEHFVLNAIHSFQIVKGWKSVKIVKGLDQAQKRKFL